MKSKSLIIFSIFVALTMLAGCGKSEENSEHNRENVSTVEITEESVVEIAEETIEKSTEEDIEVTEENIEKSMEDVEETTEEIIDEPIDDNTAMESDYTYVRNCNNFIEKDGLVYFYVPSENALNETALFAEFAPYQDADLYSFNLSTREVKAENQIELSDEYTIVLSDDEGQYVVGERFEVDKETHMASYIILPVKAGNELDEITLGEAVSYLGIDGDCLFYISDNYYENLASIYQVDMISGEKILLGEFNHGGEYGEFGIVDQVIFDDSKVYFSYGLYQGTAQMYTQGYLICVAENEENSIEVNNIPGNGEELARCPFFSVNNGTVELCAGEPNSLGIGEGYLGRFDNCGMFMYVLRGYDNFSDLVEGQTATYVETGNVIGDYIYFVESEIERAPEEDVGWRYAYRRVSMEVKRAHILTGEVENLL